MRRILLALVVALGLTAISATNADARPYFRGNYGYGGYYPRAYSSYYYPGYYGGYRSYYPSYGYGYYRPYYNYYRPSYGYYGGYGW